MSITSAQIAQYERDGYAFPFPVLAPEEDPLSLMVSDAWEEMAAPRPARTAVPAAAEPPGAVRHNSANRPMRRRTSSR